MKLMQTLKKIAFRFLLLSIAAPLINSILYGIGSVFHEVSSYSVLSPEQYNNYQNSMMLTLGITVISVLGIESLYSYTKINKLQVNGLYFLSVLVVVLLTLNQFSYRPLEHTLTIISILAIIPSRIVLVKLIPKLFKR